MLKHFDWKTLEKETLTPLFDRQLVVGEKVMLARVMLKKGAHVPEHSHMNEQVTHTLKGAIKFRIDGREITLGAGETLCIPPNMPHEAWAVEDCEELDIFTPPREDWINKTDAYLRDTK